MSRVAPPLTSRGPFLDPRTNRPAREWLAWFDAVAGALGGASATVTNVTQLDSLAPVGVTVAGADALVPVPEPSTISTELTPV